MLSAMVKGDSPQLPFLRAPSTWIPHSPIHVVCLLALRTRGTVVKNVKQRALVYTEALDILRNVKYLCKMQFYSKYLKSTFIMISNNK